MSQTKAQLIGGVGFSTADSLTVHNGIAVTGVVTATSFAGNISGDATGLSGSPSIVVTDITASGNVSIAGTLTYEDVTNVDSIGIITARSDVSIADKIIHTGDTDTAIRFPVADTFTVETSGSERVRVTSAGLVGIGTDNPGDELDIQNDGPSFINIKNNTNSGRLVLGSNTSANQIKSADSGNGARALQIFTGTTTTNGINIDTSGQVIIGGTSPASTLHVSGSSNQTLTIQTTTVSADTRINFRNSSGTDAGGLLYKHNGNHLIFKTGGSNAEQMRIDGSGRVGIGTDSPSSYSSSTNNLVISETGGNSGLTLHTGTSNSSFLGFTDTGDTNNQGYIGYSHSDNALVFAANSAEAFRVDSSQRLLVGTDSAPLDDVGARIQESSAQGCSFVMHRNDSTVVNDDSLGLIRFYSNAGSSDQEHARISGLSDGAAGANDKPGKLVFYTTADGASSPTERMRIDSSGKIGIGDPAPDALLSIKGDSDSNTTPSIRLKDGSDTREVWITNSGGDLLLNVGGDDNVPHGTFKLFESGILTFSQEAGERFRCDTSGRVLINQNVSSPSASDIGAVFQVNEASGVAMSIHRNSGADAFGANICFRKTRSSAADGTTVVVNDDALGQIQFMGTDGDQALTGAQIQAAVDGTASNDVMPGRLMFFTNGGGTTTGERMRIASNGVVTVKNGAVAEIDTLTSATSVTPDFAASCNFTLTLGHNVTLNNPSNLTAGQSGSIFLIQDGTGSRTLSFGTYWDFAGGTPPTISTVAGSVDRLDYIVRSSTSIHAVVTLAYS